jgi:hypothetical protein
MPMNFLWRIQDATFPLAIQEECDIQCAAVLVAAKLIEANLPQPGSAAGERGVILNITPLGRAALNRSRDSGGETADGDLSEV